MLVQIQIQKYHVGQTKHFCGSLLANLQIKLSRKRLPDFWLAWEQAATPGLVFQRNQFYFGSCSLKHLVTPCGADLVTCQDEAFSVAFRLREIKWGRRAGTEPTPLITKHVLVDCSKASSWYADRLKIPLLKTTHFLLLYDMANSRLLEFQQ